MNGELKEIVKQIMADERNRSYTARGIGPVFQADPDARILIIGQAPGRKVEETGIPFNDKSGEKLMQWLGVGRDVPDCPSEPAEHSLAEAEPVV